MGRRAEHVVRQGSEGLILASTLTIVTFGHEEPSSGPETLKDALCIDRELWSTAGAGAPAAEHLTSIRAEVHVTGGLCVKQGGGECLGQGRQVLGRERQTRLAGPQFALRVTPPGSAVHDHLTVVAVEAHPNGLIGIASPFRDRERKVT